MIAAYNSMACGHALNSPQESENIYKINVSCKQHASMEFTVYKTIETELVWRRDEIRVTSTAPGDSWIALQLLKTWFKW